MEIRPSFYQYSFMELSRLCHAEDLPKHTSSLLYNWHYKKNNREMTSNRDLSLKAREFLSTKLDFSLPKIHTVHESDDQTVKFLFELFDGKKVESVLIPFQGKYTICLSCQVGCAMNCAFCFTGKQGFSRNLNVEEIIGQFLESKRWLSGNRPENDRILNIVYMGQGEPLHNFDSVKTSAEIFLSQHGLSLGSAKITVSTSGYLPGLLRWKSEMPNVNIALSLHSAIAKKREELIPIQKKYPLAELMPILDSIPKGKNRFVTYEYLLIKDFNDSNEDAKALGELLKGKKAYINLIPFNPFPGSKYERPSVDIVNDFKSTLDSFGIPVTLRSTKGDDILAACGQLNSNFVRLT